MRMIDPRHSSRLFSGTMWAYVAIGTLAIGVIISGTIISATAAGTYTWTLVEGPAVALHWPDGANSPSLFDANNGLLGRIIAETSESVSNLCELPESFPCASGSPPVFLLPTGAAEGPANTGGGVECNRKTIACNSAVIPGAAHGGHPAGNQDGIGEYSYLVIHTPGAGTLPGGKGISFISGSYVHEESPYLCGACGPTGPGQDVAGSGIALINLIDVKQVRTLSVSLWLTQSTPPFGHALLSLAGTDAQYDQDALSRCGNGILFQNLHADLCVDGVQPGTGNFSIPAQKVVVQTYSVNMANHASVNNPGRCNPPDCYIQQVIIPAAIAQNPNARNVQFQTSTTVLPPNAPGSLANATVDTILFSYTTKLLDMDNDGTEDIGDPCPNDPTNFCKTDLFGAGDCPTGQVFCANQFGDLGCLDAFLCNLRVDANQDCFVDSTDFTRITGEDNGVQGTEAFGSGLEIGPFNP